MSGEALLLAARPQFVRGRKFVRLLWGKWTLTFGWMGPL